MSDEYKPGLSGLVNGAPLIIEDLDLSGLGLYLKKDPTVPDSDYFDSGYTSFGRTLWERRSEEGIKWHVYEDREIKPHKILT